MANPMPTEVQEPHFQVDPRFTDLHPIAYGGNGILYSAIDSDCDKAVAIKKLCFLDKKSCKYVLREIRIMRRLQHENIVTVYEVLGPTGYRLDRNSTVNLNEWKSIYLVQELLDANLSQVIHQDENTLTNEHVRLFLYQLLRGLKYIHSANVVHRDLKPANLLINVEDLVLKIADFGLARVVDMDYSHKGFLTDGVGTCWYRSPELIVSPRDYTKAIDIWGVGCIFSEMLTGKTLFPGANEMDQVGLIIDSTPLNDNEWNTLTQVLPSSVLRRRSKNPKHSLRSKVKDCDSNAVDLLEKLLVFSPGSRKTAEEALSHPYLQKYSSPKDEPTVCRSLHIEYEADEMSPKTLRRMISQESCEKIQTCGSCDEVRDYSNKASENTQDVPDQMSDNEGSPVNTEIEIIPQGEIIISDDSMDDSIIEEVFQKEMELGVVVDLPDEENKKEQLSPKEEKSVCEKDNRGDDSSEITKNPANKQLGKNFTCPKVKDRINEEKRAESPREILPIEKLKIVQTKGENERNESPGRSGSKGSKEKGRTDSSKKQKMRKNKNNKNSDEAACNTKNQDFDSMYRLPTEHLTQRRNSLNDRMMTSSNRVEDQLKLHEQLNEKLKLRDRDRWTGCVGAVGGKTTSSPSSDMMKEEIPGEMLEEGLRSRSGSGSSGSNQEREDSPSIELQYRRFEH